MARIPSWQKLVSFSNRFADVLKDINRKIMNREQSDFFDACRKGDVETIVRMYNDDPQAIDIADPRGFNPLVLAVYNQSTFGS